jgi:hypothetical protein
MRSATSRCRSKVNRSSARPEMSCMWHRTAHRKFSAFSKSTILILCEQSNVDQSRRVSGHLVDIFADPVKRVQIAQSALAIFHIWFDHIAAVAHTLVALVAFDHFFGGRNLGRCLRTTSLQKRTDCARHRRPDRPRRTGLRAGLFLWSNLPAPFSWFRRSSGWTDRLSAPDPKAGKASLRRPVRSIRAPLVRGDEGDIDIAVRRHLSTPISANRYNGDFFRRRLNDWLPDTLCPLHNHRKSGSTDRSEMPDRSRNCGHATDVLPDVVRFRSGRRARRTAIWPALLPVVHCQCLPGQSR